MPFLCSLAGVTKPLFLLFKLTGLAVMPILTPEILKIVLLEAREIEHINMKALSLTFLLVVGALLSGAQVKNDLVRQKLKGKIKSITELEYSPGKDTLRWKVTYNYNKEGDLLGFETFSTEGTLFSKSVCNYNDSGKLKDQERFKADGSLFDRTTYTYDWRGNKAEEHDYDASGTEFQKVSFRYDGRGNRINKDCFNEYGALFLKCNYKFDADGNEIEAKEYDSHHGLRFVITYEYSDDDNMGNWLTRSTYKNDNLFAIVQREIAYY
jgi:hypothetical protein